MRHILWAVPLALVLTACERRAQPVQAPAATTATTATTVTTPPPHAAGPPSAPASPFYVGRWAARPGLCESGAWTIRAREMRTAGEISCRFDDAPRGSTTAAEVGAACTADGAARRWRLRFSYDPATRRLTVADGPFAEVALNRCRGSVYPEVAPRPPGSPGALPDDRTPVSEAPFAPESAQGAANVVQTYFALLEAGRYGEAWKLWSDGDRASGQGIEAFVAGFDAYDSYHGLVGAPGAIEGAAGSLYVEVPVQVYGRTRDGRETHLFGHAALRRVNDVPGASAEQRRWRIARMQLAPAP